MVKTTRPPHPYEDSEDRHARGVASRYGLTPKVEAAIRYTIKNEQWNRLRMLMDPLHPADKADFLERISSEDLRILVRQVGSILMPKFYLICTRRSVRMFGICWP